MKDHVLGRQCPVADWTSWTTSEVQWGYGWLAVWWQDRWLDGLKTADGGRCLPRRRPTSVRRSSVAAGRPPTAAADRWPHRLATSDGQFAILIHARIYSTDGSKCERLQRADFAVCINGNLIMRRLFSLMWISALKSTMTIWRYW